MDGLAIALKALAAAAREVAFPSGGRGATADVVTSLRGEETGCASGPAYEAFRSGALGGFPYYWQNPLNLRFSAATYAWIASGLKGCTTPVEQDGVLTNRFLRVLSSIVYTLSTADQEKLSEAQAAATNEQCALLDAWQSAFGALPSDPAGDSPINLIMQEILNHWARPPITLNQLVGAVSPRALLNQVPPAGAAVLAPLTRYLAVIGDRVSLLNQVTRNTGLLHRALAALQQPTAENGALLLQDGTLVPAFVVSKPVSEILAGLGSADAHRTARLTLAVSPASADQLSFTANGQAAAQAPAPDLLALWHPEAGEALGAALSQVSCPATIVAEFSGVTAVGFGPPPFSPNPPKHWFWPTPVQQAMQNGAADVTGFKFRPQPPLDLLTGGGLGYLTSVLISRDPTIRIAGAPPDLAGLERALASHPGAELRFLGQSLGALGHLCGYTVLPSAKADGALTLQPPSNSLRPDGRAFVLGVQTASATR